MTFIVGLICYILGALSSFALFALCMSAKDRDQIEKVTIKHTKQTERMCIGEVVYTKSNACVLDIGLVKSVAPFEVYARCSKYSNKIDRCYGSVKECDWNGTGTQMTFEEWRDLTIDGKGTEEICNILGIPLIEDEIAVLKQAKEVLEESGELKI